MQCNLEVHLLGSIVSQVLLVEQYLDSLILIDSLAVCSLVILFLDFAGKNRREDYL